MRVIEQKIEIGIKTKQGLRDVTSEIENKILEFLKRYDVIRGVTITRRKSSASGFKYNFKTKEGYEIKGKIPATNEILEPKDICDVVITDLGKSSSSVKAQIYHDFNPGEKLKVKITSKGDKGDPCFKLGKKIIGYAKPSENNNFYDRIRIGGGILVEVIECAQREKLKGYLKVKPIEILENGE